jgi:hypothetical protein
MSNKEQHPIVDMLWLTNGTPDPFPEYPNRLREDLPMADFSDDALGNYAFMYYDRDVNAEVAVMMNPQGEHRPKIAFMTAIKERVRWLSRRLAIAEGRYPGIHIPDEVVKRALEQEHMAGRLHAALSRALCTAMGKSAPTFGDRQALLARVWEHVKDLGLPEGMYYKAFGCTLEDEPRPTNSEVLRKLQELIKFVEEKTGIKVDTMPQAKGVDVKVIDDAKAPADMVTEAEVIIGQDSLDKRLETKPAYDPKEFSKHPSSVGWSTLDGTPPPEGFDITPPAIEPGDVYLGSHINNHESGYIVHGLVDKHGLKVTYLCSKAGNLIQVLRWTEGLSRSYFEFKDTVDKIAAYDLVRHPNPAVANSAAYPEWRDAITALYITLGVEGDKISRTDLTLKLCNEADLTLEVGGKLIVSALGYDQTLTMVQRLGALHDLIILLARQGKYVPVRGDSIYRPDDSGFTIVVQSKIHVAGMPVKVHRDVNLDNVHQIDKRG